MLQRLINYLFPFSGKWNLDVLSGLTVALALIPESIAFALVAHLDPIVGLYSAFFMCLITALFGGRPGMISGATGAMAVVIVSLVVQFGVEYVFATVVLTGLFQILVGTLGWGKLIRILPKPVMIGFVNGLAIVIFVAQLEQFKLSDGTWLSGNPLYLMIGLVGVAMAITHFLPRLTKQLPSALVAIITVTGIVHLFGLDALVVSDMMGEATAKASLPTFAWLTVPFSIETFKIIVPYAITLCIIGLSESLMTLSLIDEMTHTKGRANKECIAQGFANIVSGLFKGMGGCAMIGQSMININSGARGRLGGIVASIALFLFIMLLWPMIKLIPLAALVGVMFMVVIETFEWTTFKILRKIPKHDALVIILVTAVTVMTNLAIAVVTGVIIAALVFAWDTAKKISADTKVTSLGVKEYHLHGPLFFGSVSKFKELFAVNEDPAQVVIDFTHSRIVDHSAMAAIAFMQQRYQDLGKKVHLQSLSSQCQQRLSNA